MGDKSKFSFTLSTLKRFALGFALFSIAFGVLLFILLDDILKWIPIGLSFFSAIVYYAFYLILDKKDKFYKQIKSAQPKENKDEELQFVISNLENQLDDLYASLEVPEKVKEEIVFESKKIESISPTLREKLNTPLNAITGLTEMLLKNNPREDQIDDLETLQFSAENLLTLINNFSFQKLDETDIKQKEVVVPKSEKKEDISAPTEIPKDIKVLVVDDNEDSLRSISKILRNKAVKHEIVKDGSSATQLIQNRQYNLVLMSLQMPVMGGYEATKVIRGMDHEYFKNIPIIALSSDSHEIQGNISEVGITDSIAKPFEVGILESKIASALEHFEKLEQ